MGIQELVIISISLAMDAFAVSICKGLNMKKINYRHTIIIACSFGIFQAGMAFLGWLLGSQFESYISDFDHWIALVLLSIVGIQMIIESFKKDCPENSSDTFNLKELFILSVATSIDALAIGITLSFLNTNILLASSLIGIITFLLSFIGVIIGNKFGIKYKNKAELAGGIILILIGFKILFEHLNLI